MTGEDEASHLRKQLAEALDRIKALEAELERLRKLVGNP